MAGLMGDYGSDEAMGSAMGGASAGFSLGGPWGAAIGGGLGLLQGGKQAKQKAADAKIQNELQAMQTQLSPWLNATGAQSATRTEKGVDSTNQSPWVGAAALAKAWSEKKSMDDKKALIDTLSKRYEQPQVAVQPIQSQGSSWALNPNQYSLQGNY